MGPHIAVHRCAQMRYSAQKCCSQMHSNAFCSQNPKSGCQDNGYVYLWDSQVFKFPLPLCSIHWGTSRRNRSVGHGWFERTRSLLKLSSLWIFDFGDPAIRKSGIRGRPSHDSHSSSLNSSSGQNRSAKVVCSREVSQLFRFDPTLLSNTSGIFQCSGVCTAHGCGPGDYTP